MDSFRKGFATKKCNFFLSIVLMLLLLAGGCAEQLVKSICEPIGKAIGEAAVASVPVTVSANAYYCRYGQWPKTGDELKTFAKSEFDGLCKDFNCEAFSLAEYDILADGRLKITFPNKKGSQSNGAFTITIPEPNSCVWFHQDQNAVDVFIRGNHFTTYRYDLELTKPILYPVKSPSGVTVTRGFPFEIIPGESTDHPHHTGVFFTYDKVNNDGFWNNKKSPPQIKHIKVTEMDLDKGRLSVISHWVGKSGKTLLEEKRDMRFFAEPNEYAIDFNIVLTAQDEKVVFSDTREGMFAIRLADWLREQGGTGEYLNSEGHKNEPNIWGRRAKWVRLEGQKDGNTIGVAIFHHPDSVNYPTFWMARGYGLFSANPLGQYEFETTTKVENPKAFNLTLQPGESALFKFKLIVYDGHKTAQELEKEFQNYAGK